MPSKPEKTKPTGAIPPALEMDAATTAAAEENTAACAAAVDRRRAAMATVRAANKTMHHNRGLKPSYDLDTERAETDVVLNALISVLVSRNLCTERELLEVVAATAEAEAASAREMVKRELNIELP